MKKKKSCSRIPKEIPEELCHEILIRLPAKSILKCKCVCRSWFSLISNPNFVRSHHQKNKNSSSSLLLGRDFDMPGPGGGLIRSIGYDDLLKSSLSSSVWNIEKYDVRMRFPFEEDIKQARLFGSCNGLLFLWLNDNYYDYDNGGGKGFLCVWNPATREYKKLPQSPNTYIQKHVLVYGLGYDGSNDNYKFVIWIPCDKSGLSTLVEVFSLRSNSWETIRTSYRFIYAEQKPGVTLNEKLYDERKPGVIVNGNLHWLAKGERGLCIVYLDFSNDTPSVKEIQLPQIPTLKFVTVTVFEENLCVIAYNVDVAPHHVEIWKMQVDGFRESWTRRFVIANEKITKAVIAKNFGLKMMWSFKNAKIVFVDSENVVFYDPKHESAVEKRLNLLSYFPSEAIYSQSLVSLNTGTYVETEPFEVIKPTLAFLFDEDSSEDEE